MGFKENFIEFQNLETGNYLLRQINPENDLEAFYEIYSDAEVWNYYGGGGSGIFDKERIKLILENQIREFEKARVYTWTISDKKSKRALGRIHLSNFEYNNKIANIGYFINRNS